MEDQSRLFRTETAGSLVPELEGMSSSARHEFRMTNHKKETDSRAPTQQAKKSRKQTPDGRA